MRLKLISCNLPTSLEREIWSDVFGNLMVRRSSDEVQTNISTEKGAKAGERLHESWRFVIECAKAEENLDKK